MNIWRPATTACCRAIWWLCLFSKVVNQTHPKNIDKPKKKENRYLPKFWKSQSVEGWGPCTFNFSLYYLFFQFNILQRPIEVGDSFMLNLIFYIYVNLRKIFCLAKKWGEGDRPPEHSPSPSDATCLIRTRLWLLQHKISHTNKMNYVSTCVVILWDYNEERHFNDYMWQGGLPYFLRITFNFCIPCNSTSC